MHDVASVALVLQDSAETVTSGSLPYGAGSTNFRYLKLVLPAPYGRLPEVTVSAES